MAEKAISVIMAPSAKSGDMATNSAEDRSYGAADACWNKVVNVSPSTPIDPIATIAATVASNIDLQYIYTILLPRAVFSN